MRQYALTAETLNTLVLKDARNLLVLIFHDLFTAILRHRLLKSETNAAAVNNYMEPIPLVFTYLTLHEDFVIRSRADPRFRILQNAITGVLTKIPKFPGFPKAIDTLRTIQTRFPDLGVGFCVVSKMRDPKPCEYILTPSDRRFLRMNSIAAD